VRPKTFTVVEDFAALAKTLGLGRRINKSTAKIFDPGAHF